jgi:hypothetical protein
VYSLNKPRLYVVSIYYHGQACQQIFMLGKFLIFMLCVSVIFLVGISDHWHVNQLFYAKLFGY